jgi:ribosomal-protein-serine acetyltransferase
MQTITVSERLRLVPLKISDADELFSLTEANRSYLRKWLPWLDAVRRVDDTRAFIRAAQLQIGRNNGAQLAIKSDGQIVGIIGHHQIDWRNRLTSLGYWLGASYQGRGLVTASCGALIDHAFNELRLNRIEIRCAVGNQRSRAIPVRLCFEEEGLFHDAEWLYDHFVDHAVYAMLAKQWPKVSTSFEIQRGGKSL